MARQFFIVKIDQTGSWYNSKPVIPGKLRPDFKKYGATLIQRRDEKSSTYYWIAKFKFTSNKDGLVFFLKHADYILTSYES